MVTIEVMGSYELKGGLDEALEKKIHALSVEGCEWHSSGAGFGGRDHEWSCVDRNAARRLVRQLKKLGLSTGTYTFDDEEATTAAA